MDDWACAYRPSESLTHLHQGPSLKQFTQQFNRTLSGNRFLMDLRRHQRFPVRFHTVFSGPKLSESVGTVINLSQSGCCLETDCQVYTGIQLALRLEVPDEAPIHIERAAVRWNRGRQLGVGFITIASPHQERMAQLLAKLKPDSEAAP